MYSNISQNWAYILRIKKADINPNIVQRDAEVN